MLSLDQPVDKLPLIGSSYAEKLKNLEIYSISDLLHHYPVRYVDRTQTIPISELIPDKIATIKATVIDFKNIFTRSGKNLQQAIVSDQSGQLQITWFNQKYLKNSLKIGETYAFSAKPKLYRGQLTLSSPEFEKISSHKTQLHTGRLVPVYPQTAGVSSKWLRSRLQMAFKNIEIIDYLQDSIKKNHQLIDLQPALKYIHFPQDKNSLQAATKRLSFDELFLLQLQGSLKRQSWHNQTTRNKIKLNQNKIQNLIDKLPFKLTLAQDQAVKEILSDLKRSIPMNRLLEGDVGSGKTVVAAIAAYATHLSGFQTILMAPTEILANQHYQSLAQLFSHTKIKVGLHTGSQKSTHLAQITVGTHALLYNIKTNPNIGLIIIDEQHRFGVKQRATLESLGSNPHRLTMSATPIPRTVALTLYGDLDVSLLDQMPNNRLPVKTWVVPDKKRLSAYNWIKEQLKQQDQVFVVCPLIDPSESIKLSEVKSATQEFEQIQNHFPDHKIGLLHGKLKSAEKDHIIKEFKKHKFDILVSTPVIEVGIDIPNATVILIEASERFGLAQLHQLRGRVGRGTKQSYCLLFTSTQNKQLSKRLQALTKHNSGFDLAKIDLKLRGPGEVFGLTQHGFADLKLAKLSNSKLISTTKKVAQNLVKIDPQLNNHPQIKNLLKHQSIETTNN